MRGTRHSGDNEAGPPVPADDVPVDKRSLRGEDADCRQAVQPLRPAIEGRRRPYGARGPGPRGRGSPSGRLERCRGL